MIEKQTTEAQQELHLENGYTIIVIEDDEGLNKLIRNRLKRDGYITEWALTGEEAISKIGGATNELLLVDLKLPDMTGKKLVESLSHKFLKAPNFIVMTGFGDEKVAVEMMQLGAMDYIVKESDFIDVLSEKIKSTCKAIDKNRKLDNAEKDLEKSEERLRLVLDNSPVPIAVTDEKNENILFWSESAIQLFGHNPKTVKEWFEVAYPDPSYRQEVIERWTQFLGIAKNQKKAINTGEYKVRSKEGKEKICEVYANFIPGSLIVTFSDISERKQVEEALIASKEKAEESDRLKSAFLSNMSHEIRTPMNGILGFASLLLDDDLTEQDRATYIDIINKAGDRLLNTINDIIDISKIDARETQVLVENTNISELVKDLAAFFQVQCAEKDLDLFVDDFIYSSPIIIPTDRAKVNSIFTNLIKNAIKFTKTGSIVIGAKKVKGFFEFSIKDTGIGIPKNRQNHIFDRFVQADIEDRNAMQGSGLGLAITKSYVEMLGGEIYVNSEEDKGSTFFFSLPVDETNYELIPLATEDLDKLKSKLLFDDKIKILIAEDDEISFEYLNALLKEYQCEITHCSNGKEAVDICRNNDDIDLILMDIKMPQMNGYEATKEIREFNNEVYIVFQSAHAFSSEIEVAMNSGGNAYITKPINKEKLAEIISQFKKNC